MGNELRLISPIPPSVNHYLGYRAVIKKSKGGKPRAMAMSYCTPDAKKYKKEFSEYVSAECAKQGWEVIPGKHVYMDCWFYFDRVDKDCNNYFKCMCDSITESKGVWEDDNIVCERVQMIEYDSKNPRIEIVIHPVDYIGVFENASQKESFESVCIGCSRYKRNCSLLKKAQAGYVQEEINNGVCSSYKESK